MIMHACDRMIIMDYDGDAGTVCYFDDHMINNHIAIDRNSLGIVVKMTTGPTVILVKMVQSRPCYAIEGREYEKGSRTRRTERE